MKEKFEQLMQNEHLTAGRLAELLDTQPARISHLRSGRNLPSFELVQKILRRFPHINPDWLLLDSEEMYRPGYDGSTASETTDLFSSTHESERSNEEENLTSRDSHISENKPDLSEISKSCTSSKIERVIVFYTDGTFRDFDKR